MKILLAAVNAKYIHTCPAIYCLKAYAEKWGPSGSRIEIAEYTINDRYTDVLDGILSSGADVIGLSVYIWNVDRMRRLIRDIRKVRGDHVKIWAGGPEVTYGPDPFLLEDGADLCMLGEGEETFTALIPYAASDNTRELSAIRGIAFLQDGKPVNTGMAKPVDIDRIPFLYQDLSRYQHRILYYESSRGCPFACAYCLSGNEHGVRVRNLDIVEKELGFFLDQKVPQVKFIDRTFNADPAHAMRIWQYLRDHDNGFTNFHFEIEADRLTSEELELLTALRPGLVQLEIGVQSANPATLKSVHRNTKTGHLSTAMSVLAKNQNINLHLDLIAGLPWEDMKSFRESFRCVYEMRPHQLQLGFLKLLKGTELYDRREEYGLTCSSDAPYEVLKTRWLSYEDISLLHQVSDRVEEYVNSQGFRRSLPLALKLFPDPFALFEALAEYYRKNGYDTRLPSVIRRYGIFRDFILQQTGSRTDVDPGQLSLLLEMIRFDQFLHTHQSRRMIVEETFSFGNKQVLYQFDYRTTSPVHGEARFQVIRPGQASGKKIPIA